jgi:hypothetical protein
VLLDEFAWCGSALFNGYAKQVLLSQQLNC